MGWQRTTPRPRKPRAPRDRLPRPTCCPASSHDRSATSNGRCTIARARSAKSHPQTSDRRASGAEADVAARSVAAGDHRCAGGVDRDGGHACADGQPGRTTCRTLAADYRGTDNRPQHFERTAGRVAAVGSIRNAATGRFMECLGLPTADRADRFRRTGCGHRHGGGTRDGRPLGADRVACRSTKLR